MLCSPGWLELTIFLSAGITGVCHHVEISPPFKSNTPTSLFFKDLSICYFYVYVSVCIIYVVWCILCVPGAHRDQKRTPGSLEQELEAVKSCHVGAGSQIRQIRGFCKSSKCFQLLSHLSSPFDQFFWTNSFVLLTSHHNFLLRMFIKYA